MVVTSRARSGSRDTKVGMVGLAAPCSDTEEDCLANGSEDDAEFDSDEDYAANRKTKASGPSTTKSALSRKGSTLNADDESVLVKSEPNEFGNVLKRKKGPERKMGGLSLPDVVRELLKDGGVLRWDATDCLYEVLNGEKFESRLVYLLCSFCDVQIGHTKLLY
jgi:hypothetical protein